MSFSKRFPLGLVIVAKRFEKDMGDAGGFAPGDGLVNAGVGGQTVEHVLRGEKRREAVDAGGILGQLPQVDLGMDWSGQKSGQPCEHKAFAHIRGWFPFLNLPPQPGGIQALFGITS
jgi:hypothetical protein